MRYLLGFIFVLLFILSDFTPGFSDLGVAKHSFSVPDMKPLNERLTNDLSTFDYSAYIERTIDRFMERNELRGVSIAVVKDERLVFAHGYGYADKENNVITEPRNIFRIASVSKLITAVAIMKLVESGKLSLDSKVFGKDGIINDEKYMPYRDRRMTEITVRELLNHSGGWTQKYGDPMFMPDVIARKEGDPLPATIDTYLKFVTSHRLHFRPGTMSSYSNLGFVLLGEVIARASGMPYEDYVRANVLLPAGITDMHIGHNLYKNKYPNEVKYYEQRGSLPVMACDGSGLLLPKSNGGNDISLLSSAGGWVASPVELMKLLVVIDGFPGVPDILSQESIKEMTTPSPRGFEPLGWRGTTASGYWWRTGSMPGTAAIMKRRPDGLSYVIITNTSSWKGPNFTRDLNNLMDRICRRVNQWPDQNLFEYYRPKDMLAIN